MKRWWTVFVGEKSAHVKKWLIILTTFDSG